MQAKKPLNEDLERSLLNFILIFKGYILTDTRVLSIGKQLAEGLTNMKEQQGQTSNIDEAQPQNKIGT